MLCLRGPVRHAIFIPRFHTLKIDVSGQHLYSAALCLRRVNSGVQGNGLGVQILKTHIKNLPSNLSLAFLLRSLVSDWRYP